MPGPSERVASSWGALAGLNVLKRINPTALPWAASGLPLRGGDTPLIIESWYHSSLLVRLGAGGALHNEGRDLSGRQGDVLPLDRTPQNLIVNSIRRRVGFL